MVTKDIKHYHPTRYQAYKLTATVITPSFPTFSMALAIKSPISLSPLAEIVPTCAKKARNYKSYHSKKLKHYYREYMLGNTRV